VFSRRELHVDHDRPAPTSSLQSPDWSRFREAVELADMDQPRGTPIATIGANLLGPVVALVAKPIPPIDQPHRRSKHEAKLPKLRERPHHLPSPYPSALSFTRGSRDLPT
jgi:hypothetical protein